MDALVTLLPSRLASAGVAREVVAWQLREWHVERLCDDAAVVVTELISNAVRHAATDVELTVVPIENGIRLEVRDGSARELHQRTSAKTDEGGRGLQLVDALADRYGVLPDGEGKRVWVELLLPV